VTNVNIPCETETCRAVKGGHEIGVVGSRTAQKAALNTVFVYTLKTSKKSKLMAVTDRGVLYGREMPRIPDCLDSRLRDGGEGVSFVRRPRSAPQDHFPLPISLRVK
jgi:hypothetical protein